MHSRRDFLKWGAAAGGGLLLPFDKLAAGAARVRPFQVPLAIPPVIKPVRKTKDGDFYVQTIREARAQVLPGPKTPIWGYNGMFPGPTFKVRAGRPVVVRRINKLKVPVSIHLHGAEVPAASDGQPDRLIEPGEAYDYYYPNPQDASTLWYHDHAHHKTSRNVYMGMAGFYYIEDDEQDELNLPRGKYDVPLVLLDRDFNKDGSLRFRDKVDQVLGDVLLVNGRPMPYFKVANRKYRFRVLNGSHTRGYRIALASGEPLIQIGSDQGLLNAPLPATSIPIWPSERAEIVIDFSKYQLGTEVVLHDAPNPNNPLEGEPIMRFDVVRDEPDTSSLPPVLREIERLVPDAATVRRDFTLSKDFDRNLWVINGKAFDIDRIDIKPRLGDTEIWTFINASDLPHPMHPHLVRFQVLERSAGQIGPGDIGWKDTVRVDPGARVRIIMKFEGFTGRYVFHCHNLAHEDHSMMGNMKVVRGDQPEQRRAAFEGGYVDPADRARGTFSCDLDQ